MTAFDYIVHKRLYDWGLIFDYNWAIPYWILLAIIFWSFAAIGTSAYMIDRKPNKLKAFGIFSTILAEYHGGLLDTLWFSIYRIFNGNWGKAFTNWQWHPFSSWFGYWDLNSNLVLNTVTFIYLIALWFLIRGRK